MTTAKPDPVINDAGINTIIDSLTRYAMRDVRYVARVDALLSAFMVASCFIEQCGGILTGGKGNFATAYTKFIEKYLSNYDKKTLYNDLRCALVHYFSVGEKYLLVRENPELHLRQSTDGSGKIILNILAFTDDLESGFNKFVTDLRTDKEIRLNATNWLKHHKIIIMARLDIKLNLVIK